MLALFVLGAALGWSYWPTLEKMAERWSQDRQYSHGFLAPGFALILLLVRRPWWRAARWEPSAWGVPLLLAGLVLRLFAASRFLDPLDALSLAPTIAGLVCLVGGLGFLRWSWPAVAFLVFMAPLPYQVEVALSQPLRTLATHLSAFLLQLLGYPALSEGHVIHIEDVRLGVINQCSGLGMVMTFFALATALAFVLRTPLLDRVVLMVSAVPIAILTNVLRISGTAIARVHAENEATYAFIHDLAGWQMMPVALALMWFLSRYLARLLPLQEQVRPLPVALPGGIRVP